MGNLTISYTGEQWRNGGNAATQTLAFSYRISNTPITNPDPLNTNAWISFSPLSFNSPTVGASAAALDGNAATNRQVFSGVLLPGVAVQPGQEIFLRWVDVNDPGNDHGLAVDDLTVTFSSVHPTNIYWINAAGGNWSTTANWNPPQVPGAYDSAFILTPGTYSVILDTNAAVQNLTLGAGVGTQTLSNNTYSLSIYATGAIDPSGVLNMTGGTLSGTDLVAGTLLLEGANFSGTATVETNASLFFSAAGTNVLSGVVTNMGTAYWTSGQVVFASGASFYNHPLGLFSISTDASMWTADTGYFYNAGLFRKMAGTNTTSLNLAFTNAGTIEPLSGVISLSGNQVLPAASILHFVIADTQPTSQYGQFSVTGNLRLGGTLSLTPTNPPTVGDSFRIITYGSYSGGFAQETGLDLGNGLQWQAVADPWGFQS